MCDFPDLLNQLFCPLVFCLISPSLPPQVTPGLARLAMKLLGPCTFNQAALPYIFENVPESYHQRSMDIFERNATVCCEMLKDVPGISPIMPAGAMYMMVSSCASMSHD